MLSLGDFLPLPGWYSFFAKNGIKFNKTLLCIIAIRYLCGGLCKVNQLFGQFFRS